MGFSIVEGSPRSIWCPITDGDTIYVGQVVHNQSNEGIAPIATATGAADTTSKLVPFGVVVGLNNTADNTVFDSTYNANSITDASPHGTNTNYVGSEGVFARGDRQAMALVALIDHNTVLQGPLFNAAYSTAPTVLTVTTGSTTGVSATTNATDVAGIAAQSALYFRTGANAGAYRNTDDTSTTALTWDKATFADVASGDTAIRVNLRLQGLSKVQFDSESTYIDIGATATTNYYNVNVLKLDLKEAGKEHANFTFNMDHFSAIRA